MTILNSERKRISKKAWVFADGIYRKNRRQRRVEFDDIVNTRLDRLGLRFKDDAAYLSISGTLHLRAWFSRNGGNFDFFDGEGKLEDNGTHNGHYDSADQFDSYIADMYQVLRRQDLVVVNAHSRGAPIGQHIVCELRKRGMPRDKLLCVTFGGPPPGTEEFKRYWEVWGCDMLRFRAGDDIVPLVGIENVANRLFGLRRMDAVHTGPEIKLEVPRWTRWLPGLEIRGMPYQLVRCLARGIVHHRHQTYEYGVGRL